MLLRTFIAWLFTARACDASNAWLRTLPADTTTERAWLLCPRADWMLWLLPIAGVDRHLTVAAACACAERALAAVPEGDTRPRDAIALAGLWAAGEEIALGEALEAARMCFLSANYGTRAELAAWAAVDVIGHAEAPGLYPPWRIARNAAEAIATVRSSEAVEAELALMADLVREHVPWPAVEEALRRVMPAEVLS